MPVGTFPRGLDNFEILLGWPISPNPHISAVSRVNTSRVAIVTPACKKLNSHGDKSRSQALWGLEMQVPDPGFEVKALY